MKKKWMCIVICLLMVATLFAGCGKKDSNNKDTKTENTSDTKPLKIAFVTGPLRTVDGSMNQNIYQGIEKFIQAHPESSVVNVVSETDKPEDMMKTIGEAAGDFDVLIGSGSQCKGIGKIALEHSKTCFILVDAYPTDSAGAVKSYENVYAMKYAEQESGFCAGMAAALESKKAKVAVVNGVPDSSNRNYQTGFSAGVDYANKHYQTKVEIIELSDYAGKDAAQQNVGGNYIGDNADIEKGKIIGNELIKKDVDVIFAAAGVAGQGVFTAVKEAVDKPNVKVIGSDADQYDSGALPDRNIVLTSALKVADVNTAKQLTNVMNGTFKGQNVLLKADTYATGYAKKRGRQQLSDDTIKKMDDAFNLVRNKTIEIPSF
ncbi:MAG: BMP family ABC transporter substrate-binding protein [Lachnospiraceae bacterium]